MSFPSARQFPSGELVLPMVGAAGRSRALFASDGFLARHEAQVVVAVTLLAYLALSAYVIIDRGIPGFDGGSRLLKAYLVFHGEEQKLATIGFLWPPVLTMVLLPVSLIPPLFSTGYGMGIVSAAFMTMAVYYVWQTARLLGLGARLRLTVTALFALNPFTVIFAVNGMGEAVSFALLAAAAYHLVRLDREGHLKDVIFVALWLGLAAVTRYELAFAGVIVGVFVFLRYLGEESTPKWQRDFSRFQRASAVLLAYASLAAFPMLLWMFLSWQIMGHPLWFALNENSGLARGGSGGFDPVSGLRIAGISMLATFPAAALAGLGVVVAGIWRRSAVGLSLGLMLFVMPAVQFVLRSRGASVDLVRYYAYAIPITFVLLLFLYAAFRRTRLGGSLGGRTASLVVVLVLTGSAVAGGVTLNEGYHSDVGTRTWDALLGKRDPSDNLSAVAEIGEAVEDLVPNGERVLIDYSRDGWKVRFGIRDGGKVLDITHPDWTAASRFPWAYVDWVLLEEPREDPSTSPFTLERFFPNLYDGTHPATELVMEFPRFRLFRLIRTEP